MVAKTTVASDISKDRNRPSGSVAPSAAPDRRYSIYGVHAVIAALRNNRRRVITSASYRGGQQRGRRSDCRGKDQTGRAHAVERSIARISRGIGEGTVHQGCGGSAAVRRSPDLDTALSKAGPQRDIPLPRPGHRSAQRRHDSTFRHCVRQQAVFVSTRHHAPTETGDLAKAASGTA